MLRTSPFFRPRGLRAGLPPDETLWRAIWTGFAIAAIAVTLIVLAVDGPVSAAHSTLWAHGVPTATQVPAHPVNAGS